MNEGLNLVQESHSVGLLVVCPAWGDASAFVKPICGGVAPARDADADADSEAEQTSRLADPIGRLTQSAHHWLRLRQALGARAAEMTLAMQIDLFYRHRAHLSMPAS